MHRLFRRSPILFAHVQAWNIVRVGCVVAEDVETAADAVVQA